MVTLGHELVHNYPDGHYETDEEGQYAAVAEKVHGLFPESAKKPETEQVQKSVYEAIHSEFAFAEFAFRVSGRLFGYSRISGILRQVWDVSMHLAIDLYVLYHFVPVGFQATIHIVKLDACDSSRGGVIEFRRQVLSQGVILAMLLPS